MTGPKKASAGSFTTERRCVGCRISKSVRSFKAGGALCKQCRDFGPPKLTVVEPAVDERLEAMIAKVRLEAGLPPRRAG